MPDITLAAIATMFIFAISFFITPHYIDYFFIIHFIDATPLILHLPPLIIFIIINIIAIIIDNIWYLLSFSFHAFINIIFRHFHYFQSLLSPFSLRFILLFHLFHFSFIAFFLSFITHFLFHHWLSSFRHLHYYYASVYAIIANINTPMPSIDTQYGLPPIRCR